MNVLLPPPAGFLPVVDSRGWRVAFLRRCESCADPASARLERHMRSDEVFFLLQGHATLFIGPDRVPVPMLPARAYQVLAAEWHALSLSDGALVAVVESSDTSRENSQYASRDGLLPCIPPSAIPSSPHE